MSPRQPFIVVTGHDVPEPVAVRARRLQTEARIAAAEHVEQLRAALEDVARLADEILDGGEAYPVGAREIARRQANEAAGAALSLQAISGRARR